MKTQAPKAVTFWVAVLIVLIGLFGTFVEIPVVSAYATGTITGLGLGGYDLALAHIAATS